MLVSYDSEKYLYHFLEKFQLKKNVMWSNQVKSNNNSKFS